MISRPARDKARPSKQTVFGWLSVENQTKGVSSLVWKRKETRNFDLGHIWGTNLQQILPSTRANSSNMYVLND